GGGLMAEPNPKELFDLGVKSIEAKDYIQAKKYFEKACGLNNGSGCNNLGVLYINGQGVEKNLTKADQYISKACKLGDQEACEALKEK
uniref:tetratricopeptide repeat protein n=1 Tax=Helicobacter pylori TaxID=210 RepID=UPI0002B95E6E